MTHSLLKRQLKKSGLTKDKAPSIEEWQQFLKSVEKAYVDADKERYLVERSLMISSQEMQEVYIKLQESETRYALSAQGANDGLWDWNLVTEDFYYSQRWLDILGDDADSVENSSKEYWLDRIHPYDRKKAVKELEEHLEGKTKHFQNEHRIKHTDGTYRWVVIRGMAVRNDSGEAIRIAGSLTDVSDRKRTEEKLAYDAVHDSLTGLPNRKKLMERLETSIKKSKNVPSTSFAILFVDIDRFKVINDSLGHQAGDELLLKVTNKLRSLIRPSDMVARLGGDEFVILLENICDRDQATQIAQRLLVQLQHPIKIAGEEIYSSVSIGIATSMAGYDKPEDIVRDADMAMYRAKLNGKSRYEIFDSSIHLGAVSQMQIEMDLRRACENNEFALHYQPIVSLISEDIIGFEALVRWNHPTRGLVPPSDFIPVAEETGIILPLGNWILHEACRQMQEWKENYSQPKDLIVSVNLSARQLEQIDLAEQISDVLRETGFDPNCLRLEITESVIMNNAEQAVITVNQLRGLGVRVSIDDFGTGYSSLSYLHRFPVDTLKVDRSFINRIGIDGENAEIVQTIITLAYNLNMDVVAEGVETLEQLNFLRQVNCSYGQGYYYSKPLDKISAGKMIESLSRSSLNQIPHSQNDMKQLNSCAG